MAGVGNNLVRGCSKIEEFDPSFDIPSTYGSNILGSKFEFRGECSGHIRGDELNSVGSSLSSAMEEWNFLPDLDPLFFTSYDSSNSLSNMASSSNGSFLDPLGIVSGAENRELGTVTNGELLRRNNESVHSFVMLKNNIPIPQLQLEDPPFETNTSKRVCKDRLSDWREKDSSSSCLIETQSRSAKRYFTSQEPETGMSFRSEEEACEFYRKYASENGFCVRLAKVERNSDGAIRKRHFYCSREGFRSNKQSDKVTKYKRKETRTGCPAKVVVVARNGKWTITQVSLRHNHELKVPNQDLDSVTDFSTDKAKERSEDGPRMQMEDPSLRHNHELEVPNRNLDSFTDFSTDKAKERSEDAQNLLNYFRRMQMEDLSFFYSVQVDSESRLKNFFWRDGRSKLDYESFGDVLILDTSFRTSRHGVICATFSGLNHHQNRILFGGAFLLDESIDSYMWLSETFMDSMNWRSPKTVFTDESRNTAIAVARIFPSTAHRIHTDFLYKNAAKNLSTAGQKSEFTSFFPERLLRCQSREEFELAWASFLDGHCLHENPWLKNVYEAREKWSHLFCKPNFSAGVEKTTETNKNISDVFDRDGLSLPEYIKQYEKETKRRRREEELADFRCHQNLPNTVLRGNSMEEEAASLYTEKIFKIFQDELLKLLSVGIKETGTTSGTVSTYNVTQGGDGEKYNLAFDCSNSTVHCSCRKFDSIGVLCVHSLKVLNTRNIFNIPPQYVLKRWTKCAKDGLPGNDSEQSEVAGGRFKLTSSSRLVQKALNLIAKTHSTGAAEAIIGRHLDTAMEEVENAMETEGLKLFGRKNGLGNRQSSSWTKRQKLTQSFS